MSTKKSYTFRSFLIALFLLVIIAGLAYGSLNIFKSEPQKLNFIPKKIVTEPNDTSTTKRDSIVNFGMELLGTPYVSAGNSTAGFDCSGFVYYVYNHFNIKVPRSSAEFENFGKEIQIKDVKKGDILLFLSPTRNVIGHMGIVTNPKGMKTDFIHSTSGRAMSVTISSLEQRGYTLRFVKAIRIL